MSSAVHSLPPLRLSWPHRRHLPGTLVLATMGLLYVFAGLSLASVEVADGRADARGFASIPTTASANGLQEPPPVPEPLAFRDMSLEEAVAYNASIPVSSEFNPAARPFSFRAVGDYDRLRALDCLTAAVHYEAAIETLEGQRAVAQVVLNRVRHPAFPKSVCGVVFEGSARATGCQFTFTCDGSLGRIPSEAAWARARKVAEAALAGSVYKPVGYATHYHTNWVVPYWSGSLTKLANVGTHIFYRWEGGWGRPPAFQRGASGSEPEAALMAHLSSVPIKLVVDESALGPLAEAAPGGLTSSIDGRAVVRRYEPLREQAAAAARAELARAEVPESLRWALTGDAAPGKSAPLGSKSSSSPGPTAPAAKPAAGGTVDPGK